MSFAFSSKDCIRRFVKINTGSGSWQVLLYKERSSGGSKFQIMEYTRVLVADDTI